MLSTIVDAFKVPELRKKILFTLAILALYRLGAYIPVPGIPFQEFASAFQDSGVSMTMLDLFTGGALSNFSVFSLGIMPYITASIIMQLMQGVIPAVGRWAKEGESGRRKITQVTRYLTLFLGLINDSRRVHARGGHCVHHVDGRAYYAAWHRQRYVAHHLHLHREPCSVRHLLFLEHGS